MKNSVHCRNSALTVFLLFSLASARLHGQNSTSWTATYDSEKSFIENKGQFYPRQKFGPDNHVLYGYDGSCTRIFFEKQGVTFNFTQKSKSEEMDGPEKGGKFKSQEEFEREEKKEKAAVLKLDEVTYYWEGANPDAQVIAEEKTGNYFNYSFYVNGVEHNENNIYGFTKLIYKNLYPNIDVEYTFHPTDGIKYAIIVHPGGDVSKIKMVYSRGVSIGRNGDLHITTSFGDIIDHAPVTFYQDNPSEIISSRFVEKGKSISFGLGAFDGSRTIVIDPWTQTPVLNNSKKVWETETNSSGDVYIYGGDSFIKLLKYNSTGTLQWTYTSPWDSANYWIGGFITHPTTGESYMTSGSNGEIRKISNAGASVWSNNPNGLTSYEYWSLAFNCDLTQLVVAGTRLAFSIPTPVIRGVIMNINLASGAQLSTTVVGYGSTLSIPPNVQEVSSICYAPNGNFYYLTLDTMGCINNALTAVNFKVGTGYAFDYYIPGYGFGTKQPISAIRANATAVYTLNGATVEKRDLNTGAVLASAAIPGGSYTNTFGGRHVNGNGGIDIDNCGNVYVGSVNSVVKYDANLNFISSSPTSFAVYDVDVNSNGEVAACGWSGGTGYIQTLNMSACAQITYTCSLTSPLSVTSSQTNIQCFGQCTGSATVNVSGGTAPYTYAWSPSGGTAATASNLCVGTYTCTITDNASGTTTATFNITQPSAALSSTQSQVNVACSGGCNGSASVVASGGTAGYTYSWSPSGGSAATAGSLCNGNYTCTITDANGCTTTNSFSITQPSALSATATSVNATCNSACNGSATATGSGGTGPYTYSWSNSQSGATATALCAGSYTVTITDNNGCTTTQTATITEPVALGGTGSATPATCGNNDGTATVSPSGGTGPYSYSWAPSGGTAATASNLGAGVYTVTITDANACVTTVSVSVPSSGGPTTSVQSTGDVSCFGGSDGSGTISASGNGPFSYSWSPSGGNAASATNLQAGTYLVTVTDAGGCTSIETVTITQPAQITSTVTAVPSTCGNSDGSASVAVSGGTGSFTYAWSNAQTGDTLTNVLAGTYSVTITDGNGCTSTATAVITNSGAPNITVQSSGNVTCNGGNNGTATISATGGTPPYTYAWTPSGGNAATANNLAAGTYTVTVTGSDGCSQAQTVTVTEPPAIQLTGTSVPENCGATDGSATVSASGGTPGYTYAWNTGGNAATISNLSAGSYTATVTDAGGCSQTTTVVVGGTGSATADAGTGTTITLGQSAQLNGSGNGTFVWTPTGSLSCSSCQNPIATPTVTTTYVLTVTDSLGCTAQDTVTIFVDVECGTVYVPNAFSPNGDHQNDVLFVRGNCIKYMDFSVYNRWGEKVFYSTDPSVGWDGTWRDKPCEAAVFTYVLKATLMDGTEVEDQGNISLVK